MSAGADDYLIKPVDPFAVQTRLVAAERVTALHRQLVDVRAQLEQANLEADRALAHRRADRPRQPPPHGRGPRQRAHARALRTGRAYGVALFDIDHFKLYNDHYGHLAGDEVLRQVAKCFDSDRAQGESLYRYGGEEFLLLLPDCTERDAVLAGERIRQAVAELALVHDFKPTTPPVVTVSGGVTSWTIDSALSVDDVLKLADEALFEAKSSGRNRIEVSRTSVDVVLQDAQ